MVLGFGKSRNIAIDLGTVNVLVYVGGKGIVLNEPSVVAVSSADRSRVIAAGSLARQMLGRTPDAIEAIRPVRNGVIADYSMCEAMLRYFINSMLKKKGIISGIPRGVVSVPCGVTGVERRAVEDAARTAGLRDVILVEEPIAAAMGAGLAIETSMGRMVVDIGGGTSEVAVISLGGIVVSKSPRVGGLSMDDAIYNYIKKKYNLYIGERTAEDLKIGLGNVIRSDTITYTNIRGRDLSTGFPTTISVTSDDVREAILEPIHMVVDAIKETIEETPPELTTDIMYEGIVLTGGGAMVRGLDQLIKMETGIETYVAEDPLGCVARGAGLVAEARR